MLIYLIYTLAFLLVWPLSYWGAGSVDDWGLILGMLYTFYSVYIIRYFVEAETRSLKIIKLLGPTFLWVAVLFSRWHQGLAWDWVLCLEIVTPSYAFFCFAVFDPKPRPALVPQFLLLLLALVYVFGLQDWVWNHQIQAISETHNFNIPIQEARAEEALSPPRQDWALTEFSFVNKALDTVKLEPGKRFTVLELWHDKKAGVFSYLSFRDMSSLWAEQADLAYYPIFASGDPNRVLDLDKLFQYRPIQAPNRIHLDLGLADSLQIRQLPAYLIFDQKQQLVFKLEGYRHDRRWAIQHQIRQALK